MRSRLRVNPQTRTLVDFPTGEEFLRRDRIAFNILHPHVQTSPQDFSPNLYAKWTRLELVESEVRGSGIELSLLFRRPKRRPRSRHSIELQDEKSEEGTNEFKEKAHG